MAIPNCVAYAVSLRVTCYMFIILPQNYFHMFILLCPLYINWNSWLNYNKVLFHCNFHILMWSLLLMLHPLIGPFIFRDLGYLYQLVVPGQVPCLGLNIALQELQAVAVMLHRMAFHLSGKVVALHLDNSTAKVYFCNQGGTVSSFLSRLACWILSLTDKHSITLLLANIPALLNVEADFLSWDRLLPEWLLLPQVAQAAFCLWGLPEVDLLASSHSTQCQHYFTLETPLPVGALGLNAFSHPWNFQVSYVFPPLALVPLVLSKFLVEHVNGQLRHLLLVAPCWMEAP